MLTQKYLWESSERLTAYSEVTGCLTTRNWVTPSGEISTESRHVSRFPELSWTGLLACPMGVYEDSTHLLSLARSR
jgi:hypothetical protein